MSSPREYAPQSVFGVLQSCAIVGGSMFTATVMKVRGYGEEGGVHWPLLFVFVRNWGFIFILVPIAWVLATLWMERHQSQWWSKRWTIGSGLLVFLMLAYFFAGLAARAGGSIISVK